jgi:hypothetical protein
LSAATSPFEFADGRIQDVTHDLAKRLVRLVRLVAKSGVDDRLIEEARQIASELDVRRHRRIGPTLREARRRRTKQGGTTR